MLKHGMPDGFCTPSDAKMGEAWGNPTLFVEDMVGFGSPLDLSKEDWENGLMINDPRFYMMLLVILWLETIDSFTNMNLRFKQSKIG